jgi:hypothetical protein
LTLSVYRKLLTRSGNPVNYRDPSGLGVFLLLFPCAKPASGTGSDQE